MPEAQPAPLSGEPGPLARRLRRREPRAGRELTLELAIPVCLSLGLLAAAGASLVVGPVYASALAFGILVVFGAVLFADWVLLLVLLFRPVLAAVPEFTVAEKQIGIDGILNIVVTVSFLLLVPIRKNPPIRKLTTWIFIAFLAVLLISLRQSSDPLFGLRQWFRLLGYGVFFWIAYTAAAANPAFIERLKRVVVLFAVVLLGMGAVQMGYLLRQISLADYVEAMSSPGLEYRLNGFQAYPHTYANMLLVATPVVLWAAWTSKRVIWRWSGYGLAFVCMAAMVATGVRTVMGGLVAVLVVFLLGTRRFTHLAVFAALILTFGLATGVFQARIDDLVNPKRTMEWDSLDDRREIWYAVDLAIAREPLKGYGLGSTYEFVASSPLRHTTKLHSSHCDYRKFLFEAGVPGGVLFVAVWLSLIWAGWRGRGSDTAKRQLSAAVAALGCGVLVIALLEEIMQDYASMALLWSIAGAAFGLDSTRPSGSLNTVEHQRP